MWSVIITHLPDWKVCAQAILSLIIALVLYYLNKYFRSLVEKKNAPAQKARKGEQPADQSNLSDDYEENLHAIKQAISSNSDIHFREFQVAELHARATLIYVDGMQNEEMISKYVMKILMEDVKQDRADRSLLLNPLEFSSYFQNKVLPICETYEAAELHGLNQSILIGFTALLIEGMPHALLIGSSGMKTRAINEPSSEALLRGPRIGFTEVLSENTSMLRRQGYSEHLEINMYEVGTRIKRKLVIAYMKEIVNPDLLQEVEIELEKSIWISSLNLVMLNNSLRMIT